MNSLLFILHVLGEQGAKACLSYYEKVYLRQKAQLPQKSYLDYCLLLDLGARLYNCNDFHSLLKQGNDAILRSTLLILSAICWYALQAPPPLKGEDSRGANPILRLWVAFSWMRAFARGKLKKPFKSTAEGLLSLDSWEHAGSFYQKPIKDIIPDCRRVIDNMIELNRKRTWHPDVRRHFDHIFTLMRPHFAERNLSYSSFMGMPDDGSPLLGCRTDKDWELTYDDYQAPDAVKEWFGIRTDLFFKINETAEDIIRRLDAHYLAFLIPYNCQCGAVTCQWASRFAHEFNVKCAACGRRKALYRKEMTGIAFRDNGK